MRSHNKKSLGKVLCFVTMFCQNLMKAYMCWLLFIFLNMESHLNVYSSKFSNINNELNVTNVRN